MTITAYQTLYELTIYTAGYSLFNVAMETLLPVPEKIREIEDSDKRSAQFTEYCINFTAILFETMFCLCGFYLIIANWGVTYGVENTDFIRFVLAVSEFLHNWDIHKSNHTQRYLFFVKPQIKNIRFPLQN